MLRIVIGQFVLCDPEAVVAGEASVCCKLSRFVKASDIPDDALFQNGIFIPGRIKLIHTAERRYVLLI
jgi:hypothetical protein